jgi:GAF domain-containing protein
MGRGRKPAKSKEAKLPVVRKSPKSDGAKLRHLEKRLAESLEREQAMGLALSEASEQQKATSEILRIISRSPTNLQPVLDAIATNAALVCDAYDAVVFLRAGDGVRSAAHYGPINITLPHASLSRGSVTEAAILDRQPVHVPDLLATEPPAFPLTAKAAREGGFRTVLSVPLLRENEAIGALAIRRREVQPFTDQQIELLKTFADQAVIAIENVRLFNATKEALEQQTATGEILGVISSSPTDVQPVFDTIVKSAMRLLSGRAVTVRRLVGDELVLAAYSTTTDSGDELARSRSLVLLTEEPALGQLVHGRVPHMVSDTETDPRLGSKSREQARARGFRSLLVVPLLRKDNVIGTLGVGRREPGPFTDDEIALLKTFADQAVIAIENVRLFTELQARTLELTRSVEQLTALGDVGRAVSSTLDLETVLTTIVARAVELSGLDGGVVFEYNEATEEFIQRVATETGGALAEVRRTTRFRKGEGVLGRTAITLEPVQVPDITVPGAYESRLRENLIASGIRAILAVPMVREDRLIGCLAVTRNHPGDFPSGTIELLRTFATQSALAIQNARLFPRDRGEEASA